MDRVFRQLRYGADAKDRRRLLASEDRRDPTASNAHANNSILPMPGSRPDARLYLGMLRWFTLADCAAAPSLFYADWVNPLGERFPRYRLTATVAVTRFGCARCRRGSAIPSSVPARRTRSRLNARFESSGDHRFGSLRYFGPLAVTAPAWRRNAGLVRAAHTASRSRSSDP